MKGFCRRLTAFRVRFRHGRDLRQPVKLLHLPGVGWLLNLAYAFGMSWLLLLIFHMQSSVAGLANLLHSIVYGVWLYFLKKKYDSEKMMAAAV
jgi:hypothetical protein